MKMIIEQMPLISIAFKRNVDSYGKSNYTTMDRIKEFARDNNLFKLLNILRKLYKKLGIKYSKRY